MAVVLNLSVYLYPFFCGEGGFPSLAGLQSPQQNDKSISMHTDCFKLANTIKDFAGVWLFCFEFMLMNKGVSKVSVVLVQLFLLFVYGLHFRLEQYG